MTDEEEDDAAVAAEYVLGLLEPDEARAFEARMELDPPFRDLVARWTEDLAGLALAVPEVRPPAGVEAALMRRLFPEEKRSWLRRLGLVPALIGGFVAALLVLWVTNAGLLRPAFEPAFEARVAAEDASLVVLARFDPRTSILAVDRQAGAVAPGRAHQLWLIVGDMEPMALAILPENGDVRIDVDMGLGLAAVIDGAVLAISDEPPGGSPLPGPSGDVLATGIVTRL